MQFRIQFPLTSRRTSFGNWPPTPERCGRLELVADEDWPREAVSIRVLDAYGREVHSKVKGDTKN